MLFIIIIIIIIINLWVLKLQSIPDVSFQLRPKIRDYLPSWIVKIVELQNLNSGVSAILLGLVRHSLTFVSFNF